MERAQASWEKFRWWMGMEDCHIRAVPSLYTPGLWGRGGGVGTFLRLLFHA
jgi:hypothetical protein